MSRRGRIVRLVLLAHLLLALGAVLFLHSRASRAETLAYTSCTLAGPSLEMDVSRIPQQDTLPVREHEEIHAAQCKDLGFARMRLKNLTASGRLSLEAPAYCAGARARLRRGDDYAITRERLFDDANAMFAGALDSSRVNAALRQSCPELAARPR